ncbi:MAG: hypothetical protein AVDCRST_MAG55-1024 [uncultured Rubrobacteraceae bacterium]|uniref:Uncharacterized protein n=1 Tax=uncultured Rubrobacteraceae bacterium TaxID=349277 RepID=A0A6J4P748_9ACTN|nr:MAG: hypothetical protein AVDCRST_MAG55-1024 [uncultured Rubrobacteraceae bacterium]
MRAYWLWHSRSLRWRPSPGTPAAQTGARLLEACEARKQERIEAAGPD